MQAHARILLSPAQTDLGIRGSSGIVTLCNRAGLHSNAPLEERCSSPAGQSSRNLRGCQGSLPKENLGLSEPSASGAVMGKKDLCTLAEPRVPPTPSPIMPRPFSCNTQLGQQPRGSSKQAAAELCCSSSLASSSSSSSSRGGGSSCGASKGSRRGKMRREPDGHGQPLSTNYRLASSSGEECVPDGDQEGARRRSAPPTPGSFDFPDDIPGGSGGFTPMPADHAAYEYVYRNPYAYALNPAQASESPPHYCSLASNIFSLTDALESGTQTGAGLPLQDDNEIANTTSLSGNRSQASTHPITSLQQTPSQELRNFDQASEIYYSAHGADMVARMPPPEPTPLSPSFRAGDGTQAVEAAMRGGFYTAPEYYSSQNAYSHNSYFPTHQPASEEGNRRQMRPRSCRRPASWPYQDENNDRKPSPSPIIKRAGDRTTGKPIPKSKSKPRKRKSRPPRSRHSSGSSSSSSGTSAHDYLHIQPETVEIMEASTDRARDAIISWYQRLRDLWHYKEIHGDTRVPQKFPPNRELGVWVNKQRMEKKAFDEGKKSSMTEKKIARLEEVGFIWGKPKGVDAWELKYQELRQYISEYGNPNVPTKFPDNRALGRWVSTQRHMWKKYHRGEAFNNLPSEEIERRINLLNALEFSWSMIPTSESDDSHQESQPDG